MLVKDCYFYATNELFEADLRSWSTLAQMMACCRMAPIHYLNQYWLIITGVLWHENRWILTQTEVYCFESKWQSISNALLWRHNGRGSVSNHQPQYCLLKRSFRCRSKKHQSSASLALCGEFTGDRWIPRTNGQQRGKCFHLMTSSWVQKMVGRWTGVKPFWNQR